MHSGDWKGSTAGARGDDAFTLSLVTWYLFPVLIVEHFHSRFSIPLQDYHCQKSELDDQNP